MSGSSFWILENPWQHSTRTEYLSQRSDESLMKRLCHIITFTIRPSLLVLIVTPWHRHLMNYTPLWSEACSYKESYQNKPTVNPQSHSCHRFKYSIGFRSHRSVQLWQNVSNDITSLRVIMTRVQGVISANCLLHVVTMTREVSVYCRLVINWQLYVSYHVHCGCLIINKTRYFRLLWSARWHFELLSCGRPIIISSSVSGMVTGSPNYP